MVEEFEAVVPSSTRSLSLPPPCLRTDLSFLSSISQLPATPPINLNLLPAPDISISHLPHPSFTTTILPNASTSSSHTPRPRTPSGAFFPPRSPLTPPGPRSPTLIHQINAALSDILWAGDAITLNDVLNRLADLDAGLGRDVRSGAAQAFEAGRLVEYVRGVMRSVGLGVEGVGRFTFLCHDVEKVSEQVAALPSSSDLVTLLIPSHTRLRSSSLPSSPSSTSLFESEGRSSRRSRSSPPSRSVPFLLPPFLSLHFSSSTKMCPFRLILFA